MLYFFKFSFREHKIFLKNQVNFGKFSFGIVNLLCTFVKKIKRKLCAVCSTTFMNIYSFIRINKTETKSGIKNLSLETYLHTRTIISYFPQFNSFRIFE